MLSSPFFHVKEIQNGVLDLSTIVSKYGGEVFFSWRDFVCILKIIEITCRCKN